MARSRRYEFKKSTMREAFARSGGFCEAVGVAYGLQPGQRCNTPLDGKRKEYDHYPLPATMEESDVLENCVVCCVPCHKHKTATLDIPVQAKTKRVSDKAKNIGRQKHQWATQRLGSGNNQRRATTPPKPKFEGDIMARRQS
ncbi:HNH endonuclease [Devosia elaeis]|nr:HNH endonuclease [Devosia elaeis]